MTRTATNTRVRVAVIEQDDRQREDLLGLLGGIPGVIAAGGYYGFAQALRKMRKLPPAMVLADAETLEDSGEDALRALREELPSTAVVVLSESTEPARLFHGLEEGISAWLEKPCRADQLTRCILLVRDGGAVLCREATRTVMEYFRARGQAAHCLSAREREILDFISQGLVIDEIAGRLAITGGTVRAHVHKILLKLGVKSQTEALAKYFNPNRVSCAETGLTRSDLERKEKVGL